MARGPQGALGQGGGLSVLGVVTVVMLRVLALTLLGTSLGIEDTGGIESATLCLAGVVTNERSIWLGVVPLLPVFIIVELVDDITTSSVGAMSRVVSSSFKIELETFLPSL